MNEQDQKATTDQIKLGEDMKTLLQAVSEMRQEMSDRFDKIESEQRELKQEVVELKQDFGEIKNYVEVQFEAVRQGIVKNHTQYNELVSEISQNRSAIFSTKAAVNELQENVYLLTKHIGQPI